MTIPRQLGPDTERRALPDYRRSSTTVERMVRDLQGPRRGAGARTVRALVPAHALRDTVIRAAAAAILLGLALGLLIAGIVLWPQLSGDGALGLVAMLVVLSGGTLALLLALAGLRFGITALAAARSRVDVGESALRVVGALGTRTVAWDEVIAVESRVLHPVHGLTAALRLRDGRRVLMPAFDRPLWEYSAPAGQDIRMLRTELHRRESARHRRR